ncbi:hypothetical protein HK44_007200 [Pseudomonas fluorescens HK44]|uniref:Uncharacterized protein n=1 Tax=Pseudomonas fluorescens HK44 TaxID=1042209 RepID=A0A010ST12_PSEFL|nr:hypothetical protein HK44_007200 [Pseudomonas fluorescens HK44]
MQQWGIFGIADWSDTGFAMRVWEAGQLFLFSIRQLMAGS